MGNKKNKSKSTPEYAAGGAIPYKDSLAIYNLANKWNSILDKHANNFNELKKHSDLFYSSPEGSQYKELVNKYGLNINNLDKIIKDPNKKEGAFIYSKYSKPVAPVVKKSVVKPVASTPVVQPVVAPVVSAPVAPPVVVQTPVAPVVTSSEPYVAPVKKFVPPTAPVVAPVYNSEIVNKGTGIVGYGAGGPIDNADYGIVPGNGNPKADNKKMKAKEGHVVPFENRQLAMALVDAMGYDPNQKVDMNQSGGKDIKISSGEFVLNKDQVNKLKMAGINPEALSPNSPHNKTGFAEGGPFQNINQVDPSLFNETIVPTQQVEVPQYSDPRAAMTWITPEIPGSDKIAEATDYALQNPNPASELTIDNVSNVPSDLGDAYQYGDNEYDRNLAQLAALVNKPGRTQEPAIERLGLTEYYPDMQNNIRVGGYSGSIVGSNDIHVAQGGVVPMAVLDARHRALEKAAANKAKTRDQLFEMATVQAAYPYQKQLDTEIMNHNNKYGELVGYDWNKLAPGSSKLAMQFWNETKKIQTLGRATKEIHEKAQELFKNMASEGKMHVSPEQQKLMTDWYMGKFNMKDVLNDSEKERSFYGLAKKLKAYDNVSFYSQGAAKVLKDTMDKVPIKINESLNMNDPKIVQAYEDLFKAKQTNDYDMYTKAMMTFVDDDRIKLAAKGMLDQHNFSIPGNEDEKLDYVQKQIMSYLGKQLDLDTKIQSVYNRERLKMDKGRYKKEMEIITPWQNIFEQNNNLDTKNTVADLASKKDVDGQISFLNKVNGGKAILKPVYKDDGTWRGKKVKTGDYEVIWDLGIPANEKIVRKSNLSNIYGIDNPHIDKFIEAADPNGELGLWDNVNKRRLKADYEIDVQPVGNQKTTYYKTDANTGQQYNITDNEMKHNSNWINEAEQVYIQDIIPSIKVYKDGKYSVVKLPPTQTIEKLDRNSIMSLDNEIKSGVPLMNQAKKEHDAGTTYSLSDVDASTVKDL